LPRWRESPLAAGRKEPQFAGAVDCCRAIVGTEQRRGVLFGGHGGTAHDVKDVGEQRGVRCLMLRQSLEQLPGA
jgi:hypothetical protein